MAECIMRRRRGPALQAAVYEAALAEVTEAGIRRTTMESIARRAGTGKATLYRRWPNVDALILDAFSTVLDEHDEPAPDTGSLRGDLLAGFGQFSRSLETSAGPILLELVGAAGHNPQLLAKFQERYGTGREAEMMAMLHRSMARGEIPAQPVDPMVPKVVPALIMQQFVLTGAAPTQAEVERMVDAILLPALHQPAPHRPDLRQPVLA